MVDPSTIEAVSRLLDYEPSCIISNAAERVLRRDPSWPEGLAALRVRLRRQKCAAVTCSLIQTARRNDADPQDRLANTLALTADLPSKGSMISRHRNGRPSAPPSQPDCKALPPSPR